MKSAGDDSSRGTLSVPASPGHPEIKVSPTP